MESCFYALTNLLRDIYSLNEVVIQDNRELVLYETIFIEIFECD